MQRSHITTTVTTGTLSDAYIYLTEDEFVCILACAMLRCPDLTIVAAVNPLLAKKIADQITMVLGIDGDVILVIMQQAIDEVNEYLNNLM